VRHELTEEIERLLKKYCAGRSMDEEEDFKAAMEVIEDTIESWIDNRCPGCR